VVVFEAAEAGGQFLGFSAEGSVKNPAETSNEERQFSVSVQGEVKQRKWLLWLRISAE